MVGGSKICYGTKWHGRTLMRPTNCSPEPLAWHLTHLKQSLDFILDTSELNSLFAVHECAGSLLLLPLSPSTPFLPTASFLHDCCGVMGVAERGSCNSLALSINPQLLNPYGLHFQFCFQSRGRHLKSIE